MKKFKQPKTYTSIIIQKDGASYKKNWILKKKFFELEFDLTNNVKWRYNPKLQIKKK